MPHLDSETIRPLYDVHEGGKPKGFKCMLDCNKITRTIRGMYMHQQRVHGIKRQLELEFDGIQPTR